MGGPEGPSLAEAVSALTLAIAQIQEMIKPKEAAPAPAPAAAATNQPGPGNEEWEEEEAGEPEHQGNGKPGQKPTVRDQVREQDEEDSEDSMDALERYRRGGKARKTKAAEPARLKGWAKKEYGECVTMAADHLAELAEMEVGAKWSGSHRTACKTHCEAIRKMCKEMSEADLTEGGATVPEGDPVATEEEKQAVLDGISEAFSSIKDWAYSLTGQKL